MVNVAWDLEGPDHFDFSGVLAPAAGAEITSSNGNPSMAAELATDETNLASSVFADGSPDLELHEAFDFDASDFTGAGQTVVVIDDGYSRSYDQSATVLEFDFGGTTNDPSAETIGGLSHGSWVAQTITGEAEDVSIIHLKAFADNDREARLADIEEALDFVIAAADEIDIAAVNLSLGFGSAMSFVTTPLSDEFAALDALGIFSIVAAGNNAAEFESGINVLAADPHVIGVSAVDQDDGFAAFSQTSELLTDITALGVDVPVETVTGERYFLSGTSFAAPTITGIAGRLQEAADRVLGEPLSDEEFLTILQQSGTRVAESGTEATEAGTEETEAPAGFKIADGDAALEYFLDNAASFGDVLIA